MLARRYAAAALGVYDLGSVGGGVGLATPPFSAFIILVVTVAVVKVRSKNTRGFPIYRQTIGLRAKVKKKKKVFRNTPEDESRALLVNLVGRDGCVERRSQTR